MRVVKLVFVTAVSFVGAALIGKALAFGLNLFLPKSLFYLPWIFDGLATAYVTLLFSNVGAVVVNRKEENQDYVKRTKELTFIVVSFLLLVAALLMFNAVIAGSQKRMTVAAAIFVTPIALLLIDLARAKAPASAGEKNEAHTNEHRVISLNDFQKTLEGIYERQEYELLQKTGGEWQQQQELAVQRVWLTTIRSLYLAGCESVNDYATFIGLLTEEALLPPAELDAKELLHYQYAQTISFAFGDFMAQKNDTIYPNCRIRPESVLPYPKLAIYRALRHFSACIEQKLFDSARFETSEQVNGSAGKGQKLSSSCFQLSCGMNDDTLYVPFDAAQVPADPEGNNKFYWEYVLNGRKNVTT